MKLEAVVRTKRGKSASRRLRRSSRLPAIIYGRNEAPLSVELDHNEVINQIDKPGFYKEIELCVQGTEIRVKLKEIQRHVFKPKVEHLDFIRI